MRHTSGSTPTDVELLVRPVTLCLQPRWLSRRARWLAGSSRGVLQLTLDPPVLLPQGPAPPHIPGLEERTARRQQADGLRERKAQTECLDSLEGR